MAARSGCKFGTRPAKNDSGLWVRRGTVLNGRPDLWLTRFAAPLYYRGALAAILVYDITNEESFHDIKVWLEGQRSNVSPSTQLSGS